MFLTLSVVAFSGMDSPQTLQFSGTLAGKHVSILVDSGSSHPFVSAAVATDLPGLQVLQQPMSVRVANGDIISCSTELRDVEWIVQNHSFHSTF